MDKFAKSIDTISAVGLNIIHRRADTSDQKLDHLLEELHIKFHEHKLKVVTEKRPQHRVSGQLYFAIAFELLVWVKGRDHGHH